MDRQKFYWTSRFFWQYAGQSEGFSALSTVLERDDLPHKQRLKFANDVTKLIHKLHDKKVYQQDLKLDDIFIAVTTLVIIHLIHFLRVKEIKTYEKSMLLYFGSYTIYICEGVQYAVAICLEISLMFTRCFNFIHKIISCTALQLRNRSSHKRLSTKGTEIMGELGCEFLYN